MKCLGKKRKTTKSCIQVLGVTIAYITKCKYMPTVLSPQKNILLSLAFVT